MCGTASPAHPVRVKMDGNTFTNLLQSSNSPLTPPLLCLQDRTGTVELYFILSELGDRIGYSRTFQIGFLPTIFLRLGVSIREVYSLSCFQICLGRSGQRQWILVEATVSNAWRGFLHSEHCWTLL